MVGICGIWDFLLGPAGLGQRPSAQWASCRGCQSRPYEDLLEPSTGYPWTGPPPCRKTPTTAPRKSFFLRRRTHVASSVSDSHEIAGFPLLLRHSHPASRRATPQSVVEVQRQAAYAEIGQAKAIGGRKAPCLRQRSRLPRSFLVAACRAPAEPQQQRQQRQRAMARLSPPHPRIGSRCDAHGQPSAAHAAPRPKCMQRERLAHAASERCCC